MKDKYLEDYFKVWYKICLEDTSYEGQIQENTIKVIMDQLGIRYEVDVK